MGDLVTETELAQAGNDPAFRQQFLVQKLGQVARPSRECAVRTAKMPKQRARSKKARISP
jgi:hypothetical protein